ncbi:hypothetical protein JXJ21_03195, partial [candidate division KSB1 bacterium]|nr:hypothetical protein [candidate division KSB1 bacterium]
SPLNIEKIGKLELEEYRLEKVIFEIQPGVSIAANIYVPRGSQPPFPAILNLAGHDLPVKSIYYNEQTCIELAKHGCIAMQFDGARFNELRSAEPAFSDKLFLLNTCLMGIDVWDNKRALDYLCQRHDVDTSRIGITGFSDAGAQAIYTTLVEPRIKLIATICGYKTNENILMHPDCACRYVPGIGASFRMSDLLSALSPMPFLTMPSLLDGSSPIADSRKLHQQAFIAYTAMKAGERLAIQEYPVAREVTPGMQTALGDWVDYWFKQSDVFKALPENKIQFEDSAFQQPKNRRPSQFKTYDEWIDAKLKAGFEQAVQPKDKLEWLEKQRQIRINLVKDAFRGFPQRHLVKLQSRTRAQIFGEVEISKFIAESEPGIYVPGLMLMPTKKRREAIILVLHPAGKHAALADPVVAELLDDGFSAIAIDYRGVGETAAASGSPFSDERHLNFVSHFSGQPILGRRVWDVLATIEALKDQLELKRNRLAILGFGDAGVVGLAAGLLCDDISGLIVSGMPFSVVTKDDYKLPPMLYLSGLNHAGDLQDLAAGFAPRPILAINCLAPDGSVKNAPAPLYLWRRATFCYQKLGARNDLKFNYFPESQVNSQIIRWIKKNVD